MKRRERRRLARILAKLDRIEARRLAVKLAIYHEARCVALLEL